MKNKYSFLPFAAKVLRVVAWIVLVVGVIGLIGFGIWMGGFVGAIIAIGGIIVSFLYWVFLLTTRELLYLLMDVEENTRNTAERITKESD
ncbi:MAG: hypothetical protein J7L92_02285 [Dehalococcoidia bacterium]|nr:hypothetical protein [Dehalococcoidia bacterium]RLC64792.1 MAG: hypothetical protein DRI01_02745 [Chloroflexota bacterium]